MDYLSFNFQTAEADFLIALLSDLPFNGFEEKEDTLVAYLPTNEDSPAFRTQLQTICDQLELPLPSLEQIPDQNWNEKWEAAFQPLRVGNIVGVRAEFHPFFENVKYELLIHPRMAFGTGHHATTYLVMEKMNELSFAGKEVFDYGCGTGILAILAKKMKAGNIDAVDIEIASYENTLHNMAANNVSGIQVYHGDITAVPTKKYQIILANINRNVILNSLSALSEKLISGGDLIVSGILQNDRLLVEQTATTVGFTTQEVREKDGWLMIHFSR